MTRSIKVCVFDAYGTLFDLHSAVARHADRIGGGASALSALWRIKQLEYSWLRSAMAPPSDGWKDFWELTQEALDFSMRQLQLNDDALRRDLLNAYLVLDAFPEVPATLERLKRAGVRTAILSNGTVAMLRSALTAARLEGAVDAVLSADTVKIFKPSPRLYGLVTTTFGVAAEDVLFSSSNAWDAAAANAFGFRIAWINRTRQPREYAFTSILAERPDLTGVPDLVARQGQA